MTAWPTGSVSTTNLDADTDSPLSARSDLKTMADKVNDMIGARGAASGVASLDASSKISASELPAATTVAQGAIELATSPETLADDANRGITPTGHRAFHGRGALVSRSTNQSINSASSTTITFNNESYDTDSIHDIVTNSERLTVPTGVTMVRVSARLKFDTNSTGFRVLLIAKNLQETYIGLAEVQVTAISTFGTNVYASTPIIQVVAGDYFRVIAYQNSGGALNVLGGNFNNWFAMEIIK